MAGERFLTTSHRRIRKWAEARGGWPAADGAIYDHGTIRIALAGGGPDAASTDRISWHEWFRHFDENDLVFLYEDSLPGGGHSNFARLVDRSTAETEAEAQWVD
jgi:hypothetical protein